MKEGEEKPREEIVGLIARNPGELDSLAGNDLRNGALVIVLHDLDQYPVIVEEAAAASEQRGAEAEGESVEEQSSPK